MVDVSEVYQETTVLMNLDTIKALPHKAVDAVNSLLALLLPQAPWFVVLVLCAILGMWLKKHYRMNVVVAVILAGSVYLVLRSFGVGVKV